MRSGLASCAMCATHSRTPRCLTNSGTFETAVFWQRVGSCFVCLVVNEMSRSLARQDLVTRRTGGKKVSHSTTNPRLGGLEHRHDKQAPERKQGFTVRLALSLIHISEPTRQAEISYAVF